MQTRRWVSLFLAAALILPALAAADGLLGGYDDSWYSIYGAERAMPSLTAVTGQAASASFGQQRGYTGVSAADYTRFGKALSGAGCALSGYSTAGTVLTANVTKGGYRLTVSYDYTARTLSLTYSSGVYINDVASRVIYGAAILPDLDTALANALPTLRNVTGRAPNRTESANGQITETWTQFTADDYQRMGAYLQERGSEVVSYGAVGKVLTLEMRQGETAFTITYDAGRETVSQTYAATATVEASGN